MRHPAEYYIKSLIIRGGDESRDPQVIRELQNHGFLPPADTDYLVMLREEIGEPPPMFTFTDKSHRPSVQYLRNEGVYELFYPDEVVQEAAENLSDTFKRTVVEQAILSRIDPKKLARKLNQKYSWFLTAEVLILYRHFYWNVNLLTFDHWGRYLYNRSYMYDNYLTMLRADERLAMFHLRLEQTIESKNLIKRTQEIAAMTLEEVAITPGTRADKVKAIGVLGKVITDCHYALSTSDMAMSTVLKQLERFRVLPSETPARPILELAPAGNFTGSGVKEREEQEVH